MVVMVVADLRCVVLASMVCVARVVLSRWDHSV